MELINSQIDKIEDLLMKMDEVIDTARSVPFSAKISIEKEALFGVIDEVRAIVYDMRKGLPHEINQARRVLGDKDNHISEARAKAEMIMKSAQSEAAKLISENEITVQAKLAASEIMENVNKEVADFKIGAAQYVDGIFSDLDEKLREALESHVQKSRSVEAFYKDVLDELYHNRKEIRTGSEQ
ncbi:MAG: hypothetical protein FWC76_04620 [Defluviitaleaceae bacterium]|nr:hypothetical protein [Defluviitaleaceae bacterium]